MCLTTTWWGWGHKAIYFICRKSREGQGDKTTLLIPREFDIKPSSHPRGEKDFHYYILCTWRLNLSHIFLSGYQEYCWHSWGRRTPSPTSSVSGLLAVSPVPARTPPIPQSSCSLAGGKKWKAWTKCHPSGKDPTESLIPWKEESGSAVVRQNSPQKCTINCAYGLLRITR